MKMAELERRSGVGRETIRYYIREGLLPQPERGARNVAAYGEVHVQRLKAIKRLQEERFLPLGLIRKVLNGDVDALPSAGEPLAQLAPLLAARLGLSEGHVDLATLVAGDPQTARDVETFVRAGVITLVPQAGGPAVSRLDARIVGLWRDVRRAGYGAEGFPATNVLRYLEALGPLAKEEVGWFFDGFGDSLDPDAAAEVARAGVELINVLLGVLRTRLLLDEVAQRTPGPSGA